MAIISNGTTIASGGSLSVSANPPSTIGAVGTYAFLKNTSVGYRSAGDTVSGNLRYTNARGADLNSSGPSGTWRLMGINIGTTPNEENNTTVCIRIS